MTVKDLAVNYLGTPRWLLGDVTFNQLTHQVTAIIGPSGCGKTTLIRTLAGLIPHCIPSRYAGNVALAGEEIAAATIETIATNVGYVGQNPDAAIITRSVHDEVAFPLQNLCWDLEKNESRVVEVLQQVGLLPKIWDDPWTLSGGQRQRLALAAALAPHPRLLILDEPTSTIDDFGRETIHQIVRERAAAGSAVVIIDHNLDSLMPVLDQVIALDAEGKVLAQGSPAQVFQQYTSQLKEIGVWLPRELRDEGVQSLQSGSESIKHPSLHDLVKTDVAYYEKTGGQWRQVAGLDTSAAGSTPVLNLQGYDIPGRSPKISLRLAGGEFLAVLGPNGAGKTSLVSGLAGLLKSEGTVAQAVGKEVRKGRYQVGYVFQNPEHQLVASTVQKEILITGVSNERCEELLKQFHLWEHRDRHPLTLSGGQARRLSVATMVAEQRQIIVLDEPTYGQDWDNTCELVDFIEQLRAEGRTVLMATHDINLALSHASHLIVLPDANPPAAQLDSPQVQTRIPPRPAIPPRPVLSPQPVPSPQPAIPPRPVKPKGLFSALNPMTLFLAILPMLYALVAVRSTSLNLTTMIVVSGLIIAARPGWRRAAGTVAASWLVAGLLFLAFNYSWSAGGEAVYIYDYGSSVTASTMVGAFLGLVLLSGVYSDPASVITTLTTTMRLPYRIGAAGTTAIAFIQGFRRDFTLLRTARALRRIGSKWGIFGPVVRWFGSALPLMILGVQHAERVALSMDSRALGAYRTRTEFQQVPWRIIDTVVVLVVWALGVWLTVSA
ncbi:ABC transporter [Boudabousia marimammalium]|uniref:ABC transporter n=2 Tax=Boudabousia marimammalium TaxID=156892 RepID=A0A1Q5PM38_9ACTO|nr:ABC transporter [Boudabousia marimammalium]